MRDGLADLQQQVANKVHQKLHPKQQHLFNGQLQPVTAETADPTPVTAQPAVTISQSECHNVETAHPTDTFQASCRALTGRLTCVRANASHLC